MATLFDFIADYGHQRFEARPLTVIDAAILAQLAYCDFTDRPQGTLGSIDPATAQNMVAGTWQASSNQRLLLALAASARYGAVSWLQPVTHFDKARQQQFSAVTWQLTPDTYYLSFRGTRASFVDWKEDFNMTFLDTIPSQKDALRYLQTIAASHPGRYYLGGHSKGGNLATYAFDAADPALKAAIAMVANLDGPGLKNPLTPSAKVLKMVPQSSVIGMIFDSSQDFAVVHSTARGLRQHDLFTWEVHGHNFVYLPATTRRSQYTQNLLAEWLAALDDETKKQALDAAYAVVANTQKDTFAALTTTPTQSAKALLAGIHTSDPADRQAWRAVATSLARVLIESVSTPRIPPK